MIANFFNKSKPEVFFIIAFCLFIYYISASFLLNFNELSFFFVLKKIGFFSVFIFLLFLLNFIIHKNNLTQNNSYALLLIVLLLGTFYETMFNNPIVFSNITLLLGFRKVYSLKSGLNIKPKLYDAGFWVGIATLIYSWSILYVVLIYIAMVIYKKLDFKNIFIPIIGLATPILIYFTYCLYVNDLAIFYNKWLFATNFNYYAYNEFKFLIPISFLLTLLLWSVVALMPTLMSASIHTKRTWDLIITHLAIAVAIITLAPVKNGSEMFFALLPLSIIVANFLEKRTSKKFKNLILYLFILISIGVYFL